MGGGGGGGGFGEIIVVCACGSCFMYRVVQACSFLSVRAHDHHSSANTATLY